MKKAALVLVAALIGGVVALQLDRAFLHSGSPRTAVRTEYVLPASNAAVPMDFREAAKIVLPSVVSIDTVGSEVGFWGVEQAVSGSGSGIIFSNDGYIITNAHVVTAGQSKPDVTVHVADGRSMPAEIVGVDPIADLAVLKVKGDNLTPAKIGKSAGLEVGQWVIAVGNPLGQDHTLSVGVVSSLGRDLPTNRDGVLLDAIQTDAAINPGNSGGALTNAQGELIGVNSAILSTRDQGSIGIGFAIPIDRALPIISDLIKYRRARYGYLGLEVYSRPGILSMSASRQFYKEQFGSVPPETGLPIMEVAPNSPAADAGLKQYDVLLKVGNTPIRERFDYVKELARMRPGDELNLEFWSEGKTQTKKIKLTERGEI